MDQEVADARARLAAKFGKPTQIGGKGRSSSRYSLCLTFASVQVPREEWRRLYTISRPPQVRIRNLRPPSRNTVSLCRHQTVDRDSIWFIGVQPLTDIEEVNMFKDDNTVIHFKRPQGKFYTINAATLSTARKLRVSARKVLNSVNYLNLQKRWSAVISNSNACVTRFILCSPILGSWVAPSRYRQLGIEGDQGLTSRHSEASRPSAVRRHQGLDERSIEGCWR